MPSQVVSFLEGYLNLDAAQRATVEAAVDPLLDIVNELNADLTTINSAYQALVAPSVQEVVNRILSDYGQIGPTLATILQGTDGMMAAAGIYPTVKDIQSNIQANPQLLAKIQTDVIKLQPLINKVNAGWPRINAAVQVIQTAMNAHQSSIDRFAAILK